MIIESLYQKYKLFFLIHICLSTSCSKTELARSLESSQTANIHQQDSVKQKIRKHIVVIQPFDGISPALISSLYQKLEHIIPEVRLNESIEIPEETRYLDTKRYRADSLIRSLWTKSTYSSVVVGVTNIGISRTTNGYQDFEIIGLAFRNGHSCVVSTNLFQGINVEERLFKSVIHELGHTQGLIHCERKSYCYMKGAKNGEYPIDKLTGFCPYCTAFLRQKGWNLN